MRILLADDHEIVLDGLRALLETQRDMQVVAAVRDGLEAVREIANCRPDVVVLDVTMRGLNGIEAARQISAEHDDVRIICLSMHAESSFVRAALEAGACGYVVKECALEELVRAIRAVHAGQSYISPAVAGHLIAVLRSDTSISLPQPKGAELTGREREVLQLVAEGFSTRSIAARLNVSHKTIGTHRGNIMDKLGISTVAGLTKYAIREGLTGLDDCEPRTQTLPD